MIRDAVRAVIEITPLVLYLSIFTPVLGGIVIFYMAFEFLRAVAR